MTSFCEITRDMTYNIIIIESCNILLVILIKTNVISKLFQ